MANSTKLLILLGMLTLIMTGCLRDTNEVDNSISAIASPTTGQSVPSSEDIISNPVVAQQVDNQNSQAPNNDISSVNAVSAPQDAMQQQIPPTLTPSPTPQQIAQIPQQSQFEGGITPSPTLDPLYARATQVIFEQTATYIAQTQTAQALLQPLPTFTPNIPQPPQQVFPTPTPTTQFLSGADCVHEVVAGENLFRLSLRYGVLVNDIARASGVTNINLILVGQKLIIPGCGTTGVRPPATSIPTQSIAQGSSFATSVPSAGGVTHIVQQGETLFQISLRYGVPVNSIAARNGISNINLIYINQELIIP
jgi:LysM repeat protein